MTFSGSGHDLDLRSNFHHDLSRSNDISFDPYRQEKHDAGKRNVSTESKVIAEQRFSQKTAIFGVVALWSQAVGLRSNMKAC